MFKIEGKIALVSGGASGLGFEFVRYLLKAGLKGVTIADINPSFGKAALAKIKEEFGLNKAIFVLTDVSNKENYENAFKKTIGQYQNLDILVNNAGICNDKEWEKQNTININGTINGILLALENYIPKYRSGEEGVIVNLSSVAATEAFTIIPLYSGTKFAILGITKAFGAKIHYDHTKVKVLAICPGATDTTLIRELPGRTCGPRYEKILDDFLKILIKQSATPVAEGLIKVIQNAESGTAWVCEDSNEPYEYTITDRFTLAPK